MCIEKYRLGLGIGTEYRWVFCVYDDDDDDPFVDEYNMGYLHILHMGT